MANNLSGGQFQSELERQIWEAVQRVGMPERQLCKMAGIDQAVFSRWKHGRRGLSARSLNLLAQTLGLVLARKTDLIQRPTKRRRTQAGGKKHGQLEQ